MHIRIARLDRARRELWVARLSDFLHDCVASSVEEEADRIREAAGLFDQADTAGLASARRTDIEPLLAAGGGVCATLAVIGDQPSFMLSRGGDGTCLATFVLGDEPQEAIAEGASLALALLAAYVSALLDEIERSVAFAGATVAGSGNLLH